MHTLEIDGPRACRNDELHEMIALVDAVMRAGSDQTFLTDYPLVYRDSNLQNISINKVNGEIVSVVPYFPRKVAIDGCCFTIGIISPTATSPDHRKKGYGLNCLNAGIEKMTTDGIDLSVLWTEIPTFRFYEHAQYQAVRSQKLLYSCRKTDAGLFANNGHSIVEYDPNSRRYITDIREMHEKEVFGVLRSAEDYPFLFSLPKMKTLIALQNNEPIGYLLVSRATNKPGLVEAGGEKAAVETLVNNVLNELDEKTALKVHGNLTPTVLGELFEERMPERRTPVTDGGMMIRINDVCRFMGKLAPWLEQTNAGTARKFSVGITDTADLVGFEFTGRGLKLGSDRLDAHVELSLREFTSIVFGAHSERPVDVPDILSLFPFSFPIWELDHS